MYIVVSYLIGACSFAYFFCCFHTDDRLSPSNLPPHAAFHLVYICNGTIPVYLHQRTGACKCHVIAAVWSLRVKKLTPAELRPFCHTKREEYNEDQ